MRVIVVGAGAIGLASALAIAEHCDAEIVVIDPRGPGGGASRRNAGWVVPSMSAPVPAPGMMGSALRWLLKRDSPLSVRPSLDPGFLRFMAAMARNSRRKPFQTGLQALVTLNQNTMASFDRLLDNGVDFAYHREGLVQLFLTEKSLRSHHAELEHMQALGGGRFRALEPSEVFSMLPGASTAIVGGLECPDENYLDPESFLDALAAASAERGIEMLEAEVSPLDFDRGHVGSVCAGDRRIAVDHVVVAAGVWTRRLVGAALPALPVYAGKGYGFDVPVDGGDDTAPRRSLYLSEGKVALTSLGNRVRLAGTMAFGDVDAADNHVRADGILKTTRRYLPKWALPTDIRPWSGMRPMTPDGLPIISRVTPESNVVIATGHAMLGITLAPVTATLVSDLLIAPDVEAAAPFAVSRFTKAAGLR